MDPSSRAGRSRGAIQRLAPRFSAWAAALSLCIIPWGAVQAQAVTLGDGSIRFAAVPRLVSAQTTQNQARAWGGRYYFTVALPAEASEPLGQLVIQQREGGDRLGRFDLDATDAFLAEDRKVRFAIEAVTLDQAERSITVRFNPPIEPGQTLRLKLEPRHTPSEGIYLFGVTAFPAGERAVGQFLGYGRLHFYNRDDRPIFWR